MPPEPAAPLPESTGRSTAGNAGFDPPNPRLLRAVRWRWSDARDAVEAWSEPRGRWVRQRPWTGAVLAGLERGEDYPALVARVRRFRPDQFGERLAAHTVRQYLYSLYRLGHVRMDFDAPPDVFADRYETVRELGRGGIGVAWLCRDRTTDHLVVVKHAWGYFREAHRCDEYVRKEADVMRALNHPGIVAYHDAFERGGLLHLVRGFVDGRDLLVEGPLAESEVRRMGRAISSILAHLHHRGFLLLDLRPANFIVDAARNAPILLDVGLCEPHRGGQVQFPSAMGSPGFAAPEMLQRHVATARSDVWGFGRLLFYLATDIVPRRTWTSQDLAHRLPRTPLASLILDLAADDPAQRPATMDDAMRRV